MMGTLPPLLYEKTGAVARIRLNRPEVLNALNKEIAKAFLAARKDIAAAPDVRAVVNQRGGVGLHGGDRSHDLAAQLREEKKSFLACTRTRDFRKALDAFASRRPPEFSGG